MKNNNVVIPQSRLSFTSTLSISLFCIFINDLQSVQAAHRPAHLSNLLTLSLRNKCRPHYWGVSAGRRHEGMMWKVTNDVHAHEEIFFLLTVEQEPGFGNPSQSHVFLHKVGGGRSGERNELRRPVASQTPLSQTGPWLTDAQGASCTMYTGFRIIKGKRMPADRVKESHHRLVYFSKTKLAETKYGSPQ